MGIPEMSAFSNGNLFKLRKFAGKYYGSYYDEWVELVSSINNLIAQYYALGMSTTLFRHQKSWIVQQQI